VASILAVVPLIRKGLIEAEKIVVDTKIGLSGGGSEPTYAGHHPEWFGGLRPRAQKKNILPEKSCASGGFPLSIPLIHGFMHIFPC
jgi:hypothetical protein